MRISRIAALVLTLAAGLTSAHAGGPTMKVGESKTWKLKNGVTVTHARNRWGISTRTTTNATGDLKTKVSVTRIGGRMKEVEWTQPSGRKLELLSFDHHGNGKTLDLRDTTSNKSISIRVTK